MPPRMKVVFHIFNLRYLPVIPPEYPIIKFKYREHPPGKFLNHVQDWFYKAMLKEILRIPFFLSVSFIDWRITSDDVKLFTVNGCPFDKITVLLGEEDTHWAFHQRTRLGARIVGCSPFRVNYCVSCLTSHYKMLIESIKIDINRDCTCNLCLKFINSLKILG